MKNALFLLCCVITAILAQDPYANERRVHYAKVHAHKKGVTKDVSQRVKAWVNTLPKPLFDLMEADARAIAAYEKAQHSLLNDKKHTRWMDSDSEAKTALEVHICRNSNMKSLLSFAGSYSAFASAG